MCSSITKHVKNHYTSSKCQEITVKTNLDDSSNPRVMATVKICRFLRSKAPQSPILFANQNLVRWPRQCFLLIALVTEGTKIHLFGLPPRFSYHLHFSLKRLFLASESEDLIFMPFFICLQLWRNKTVEKLSSFQNICGFEDFRCRNEIGVKYDG